MISKLKEARAKHQRFIYESFNTILKNNHLIIKFSFLLEPDIRFSPQVNIPYTTSQQTLESEEIKNLIFHIGLIETLSYWKASCPKEIIIKAGALTKNQIRWWSDLYKKGLSEFFYTNSINFLEKDFLIIKSEAKKRFKKYTAETSGNLILASGGKDSAVMLELLKDIPNTQVLLLNPTPAALKVVRIAGFKNPIIVRRRIDPKLLDLNKKGYFNGHTPFSAYLAFLGVLVAALFGYKNVIVANEKSSNEPNLFWKGFPINHQYSKTLEFEKKFRAYVEKYLTKDISYFSLLRPFYELQIAKIFSFYPQYFQFVKSCNKEKNKWCGKCAKCAFVYLVLFQFLEPSAIKKIFEKDYFRKKSAEKYFASLALQQKPFECVGTKDEIRLAVIKAIQKYKENGKTPPKILVHLQNKLKLDVNNDSYNKRLEKKIFQIPKRLYFVPEEFANLIKEKLNNSL